MDSDPAATFSKGLEDGPGAEWVSSSWDIKGRFTEVLMMIEDEGGGRTWTLSRDDGRWDQAS